MLSHCTSLIYNFWGAGKKIEHAKYSDLSKSEGKKAAEVKLYGSDFVCYVCQKLFSSSNATGGHMKIQKCGEKTWVLLQAAEKGNRNTKLGSSR